LGFANLARFGFRYLVSSGNEAGLDSADYIGYFVQDSQTQVILAFLEGIRSSEHFVAAAEPVVMKRAAAGCAGAAITLAGSFQGHSVRQDLVSRGMELLCAICDAFVLMKASQAIL